MIAEIHIVVLGWLVGASILEEYTARGWKQYVHHAWYSHDCLYVYYKLKNLPFWAAVKNSSITEGLVFRKEKIVMV
jgi:hypothetical protein